MITPTTYENEFLENAGFKITQLDLDLTGDGWLRLHAKWTATEEWKTKYPVVESSMFSLHANRVEFGFNPYGKDAAGFCLAQFSLGIENESDLNWFFKFTENIKYGVNVYFAPKNWNQGPDTPITSFNLEKDKEMKIHKEIS